MPTKAKQETKDAAKMVGDMIKLFSASVAEILENPEVKAKGKEFAASVVDAAAKVAQSKVKDEEVRAKFRTVGTAAKNLGETLEKKFNSEKEEA